MKVLLFFLVVSKVVASSQTDDLSHSRFNTHISSKSRFYSVPMTNQEQVDALNALLGVNSNSSDSKSQFSDQFHFIMRDDLPKVSKLVCSLTIGKKSYKHLKKQENINK
jgi:hypothetical protein